ncbi:MAG: pilus assembly PilX N-terminal domain-containing protein, partial [Proteobacteria bacterium]|nr:pilus assembly PilX N-terminal domain-containing protein [Pseudomonadota bacterium]
MENKDCCNERGAILVVALVLMIALIMMGSLAVMITITERNISRNHKMAKEAFYLAD